MNHFESADATAIGCKYIKKGTILQWSVGGVLISRTLAFEPVGG